MMNSNALTVPLALLLSWTLSAPTVTLSENITPTFNYCIESSYQTTSINLIAKEFDDKKVNRIATLTLVGYYMLICKLTVFFLRPEDVDVNEARFSP